VNASDTLLRLVAIAFCATLTALIAGYGARPYSRRAQLSEAAILGCGAVFLAILAVWVGAYG
jgi:hypothetical protein